MIMEAACPAVRGPSDRPRLRTDCNGYLIAEIMVAVAVFSIGFLAVGSLIVATSRNNTTGNIVTQATLLASQTLEALKQQDVAGLAPGAYTDPNNPVDDRGRAGGIYTRSWVIADPVGYNTSRRISVSVSWDRLGQSRAVQLTTITRGNGT